MQTDFIPCFHDYEVHVDSDKSGKVAGQGHAFYFEFAGASGGPETKTIKINDTTGKLSLGGSFSFGDRAEAVLSTPTSVFTYNPNEEFLILEEYDLASGQKLRSLQTGMEGGYVVNRAVASPTR